MYTIDVLIPFEMIVDIDMGLIKLLEFDYDNGEYFERGILHATEEEQQYLLNKRTDRNPLSVVMRKDDPELMEDLYNQFMEKEYQNILELSCNTALVDIANTLKTNMDQIIRITVLCKSKAEENILKIRKIPLFRTLIMYPEAIDLSKYDTLYVKDVNDLDKFKKEIFKKNIYVANYGFNVIIDPEQVNPLLPPEIVYKYGGKNDFFVVSMYQFDPDKLPLE